MGFVVGVHLVGKPAEIITASYTELKPKLQQSLDFAVAPKLIKRC